MKTRLPSYLTVMIGILGSAFLAFSAANSPADELEFFIPSGNWSTAANWRDATTNVIATSPPAQGDDATIRADAVLNSTVSNVANVRVQVGSDLDVESGAFLTINSNFSVENPLSELSMNDGEITVIGQTTVTAGGESSADFYGGIFFLGGTFQWGTNLLISSTNTAVTGPALSFLGTSATGPFSGGNVSFGDGTSWRISLTETTTPTVLNASGSFNIHPGAELLIDGSQFNQSSQTTIVLALFSELIDDSQFQNVEFTGLEGYDTNLIWEVNSLSLELTPIPEPQTIGLILLSITVLTGVSLYRRRKLGI